MFIVAAVMVVMAIVVWGGLRALRAQVGYKLAPSPGSAW
jgi:hypothetical protein